jgi:hypothetical protein
MQKQVIFYPHKSYKAAAKYALKAIRDLGAEEATEIGIELLKVDNIFYTVKNPYKPQSHETILDTNNATERYSVAQIQAKVGA